MRTIRSHISTKMINMQYFYEKEKKLLQLALAKIIQNHRKINKKSISLICNETEMTKSLWADLEHGKKDPQLTTLWRIAEALELPLSQIIKELEQSLGQDFSMIFK